PWLVDSCELLGFQQKHGGDRATVPQIGPHAHRAEGGGLARGLLHRFSQRDLCLRHRGALRPSRGEIAGFCEWLDCGAFAGGVIDQHLRKLAVLCRVDRELEPAVLDLAIARDRLTFLFARGQSLLQADLGAAKCLDQRFRILVLGIFGPDVRPLSQDRQTEGAQSNNAQSMDCNEHQFPPRHVDLYCRVDSHDPSSCVRLFDHYPGWLQQWIGVQPSTRSYVSNHLRSAGFWRTPSNGMADPARRSSTFFPEVHTS